MSQITEKIRASASEFYQGKEMCQEKSKFLLKEMGLPNGLLPMEDMEECGYVKDTGFVWLKSKKKTEHKFKMINKLVQYAPEVTAYVEQNRIRKLTGVKAKELLMWVTLTEIYVDEPSTGSIHFKTPAGLSRTFPVNAFVVEEPIKDVKPEKADQDPAAAANGIFDRVDAAKSTSAAAVEEAAAKGSAVEVKEV